MKEVSIKVNNQQVLTSMEVAEMIGKDHKHLMRDIRRYVKQVTGDDIGLVNSGVVKSEEELNNLKQMMNEFFVESAYIDAKKESRPCYLITRKGCEFVSNKLVGVKGTVFTVKYVNRFHDMEAELSNEAAVIQEIKGEFLKFVKEQNEFNKKVMDSILPKEGSDLKESKKASKSTGNPFDLAVKKRVKELMELIDRVAELHDLSINEALHIMYREIEKRCKISMRSLRNEYQMETGDTAAGNLDAISHIDWLYKYASDMCKSSIKKCEVF